MIFNYLQSLSFLYSPNLVTFWSPFYSNKKEPPLPRRSSGDSNKTLENLVPDKEVQGIKQVKAKVADKNDNRKAYGCNLMNFLSGSSGILFLSFCARIDACTSSFIIKTERKTI